MKKAFLSRRRKANKLLQKYLGYLLEPDTKPDRKEIRRLVISSLRKDKWRSKNDNPYQRKKLYDELTERIVRIQSDEAGGNEIRSANVQINKWKQSDRYKEAIAPIKGEGIDDVFMNTEDLFQWFEALEFHLSRLPNFTYEVVIPETGYYLKGDADLIAKNKTKITAEAKLLGSDSAGFKTQVDFKKKIVRITFFSKKFKQNVFFT
jgi:hypothetical protein